MLFNSFDFAVFMPVVFLLYWLIFNKRSVRTRNLFILLAGYTFYSFWDWRFTFLLVFSSAMDYLLGRQISRTPDSNARRRKLWLILSVVINLGILGFFKYFNFFVESFMSAFTLFGSNLHYEPLRIILPVGVSFYTFQSLSYIFDIYRKKVEPVNDLVAFMAYVSFFPQLVAGPIERSTNLLPQFLEQKTFDYQAMRSSLLLIAWGLFKKIVIADRLAVFVNGVYADVNAVNGLPLAIAALFFAFQLYLDFSAYSDIARGTGQLLGFRLMVNFRRPYLAASFSEFWKRWHISLSSWFQDYVYIPLGGNRKGATRTMINLMIVFLLSGLWHGASWNFVIWGALNGLFLIVFDRVFKFQKSSSGIRRIFAPVFITASWAVSLIFFRAQTFADAVSVFSNIGWHGVDMLSKFGLAEAELKFSFYLLAVYMLIELCLEKWDDTIADWFFARPQLVRWAVYISIVLCIVYLGSYGAGTDNTFIYFQF